MNILAIESSCDETAASVVADGRKVLSNVVASQVDEHVKYGGVVPEIASRRHAENISWVVDSAVKEAGLTYGDIDAVGVTYAPGLIGALLVGVNFAKGLSYSLNKPLIPVHHLRSHIASNYITFPELEPPFLALVVSGGHSHIVKVNSYTEDEKLAIAKEHILKKELEKHNLTTKQFEISDNALLTIIRNYTFEAGVRNLERNIESIVRKATRKIVEDKKIKNIHITERNLKDYLGVEKYDYTEAQKQDTVGVATGMAYTEMGGDLLYLEALKFDGNGKLNITGKLGDVMKESVQAAFSYVRSKASEIGIDSKKFNKYDFHVHVPEGATPKDGPSAGVAISVALMSCLSGLKVKSDTAMTGEITLTGKVLPIGGLREKLLAALRGRIKNVLIPKKNIKDIEEIPEKVQKGLNIVPIETIEEAFKFILVGYDKLKDKKK